MASLHLPFLHPRSAFTFAFAHCRPPSRAAARRRLSTLPLAGGSNVAEQEPALLPHKAHPQPAAASSPPTAIPHVSSASIPAPSPSPAPPKRKPAPEPSTASVPAPDAPIVKIVKYPYSLSLTATGNLPVYSKIAHRNRYTTLIRNIHGSSEALRRDLLTTLFAPMGLTDDRLMSKVHMPGHVEFKGDFRREIVQWLRQRGF